MSKKKDNEFQRLIRTIYGNSELDRRTKKLLEYTWKTNPDIIRLTAKQKTNIASLNGLPKMQLKTVSDIALSLNTSIQDVVPQRRSDDFSGMSFSEAFRRARLSGLNTFRWNSGIYGTELATPNINTIELPEIVITPDVQLPSKIEKHRQFVKNLTNEDRSVTYIPQNIKKIINWLRLNNVGRRVDRHDNYTYLQPGKTTSFQLGGQLTMNEQQLQQAFLQYLAQKTGAKNQQELEAAIQSMGEEGLKQAYAEFMQMIQQLQVQAAKFGAKLNYIKNLRGLCPEGYEMQYYKSGGLICKKCMKKHQTGGAASEDTVNDFKSLRKLKKKAQGGGVNLNNGKCRPFKKQEGGGLNSTFDPNSYSKMTLAKCGTKLKEACKGIKFSNGNKIKSNATGGAVSGKVCKKKASGGTVSTPKGTYSDSKGTPWKPGKRYNPKG